MLDLAGGITFFQTRSLFVLHVCVKGERWRCRRNEENTYEVYEE